MASEWTQLELPLPVVGDVEHEYAPTITATRAIPNPSRPSFAAEPADLSDAALLTTLLGPSSELACEKLAVTYGSFRRLSQAHPADLRDHGLKEAPLRRLAAIFEIAKRHGEEEFVPGSPFRGSYDVYAHFREHLAAETIEHFFVVLLDNKHRKIRDVEVARGSLTATIVHPRDVFSRVLRDPTAAVVFVHNHPSGDPTPSREDVEITRRLRDVAELVGVRVLDHIVIGQGRYVSFVDDGLW